MFDMERGSSPRTWGTLKFAKDDPIGTRFIPTDVGNTKVTLPYLLPITVHPHGRGEHSRSIQHTSLSAGSSPRTWGTLQINTTYFTVCRFIPTDVGNTPLRVSQKSYPAVHPHGRGEHLDILTAC